MAVASKTWTTAYGRYVRLRITAQEVEVDTPNNRSKVRVTGQVYYEGGTTAHNAYPQTYTVTVNGTQIGRQTGFTYSLSSGKSKSLTTYTSGWINHNSNGAKSVTVRGHITDNAGDTGTISQSYALTTIARASTLSSFSMPNSLKPDTTTTFNLGISRKSSSFTHDISLRDGSTVIASWTGQATPTTRSLTAAQTNTLLKRMSSSTSRTMTLRVQTKSGSTNIGGALTRTATVRVSSTVKPTVEKLSVTIEGNAHAKTNVKRFVQNISRVSGKFTRSAKGGASIKSSKLEIRRKSGGHDVQTINSNSGTFSRVVAWSGQYQARGTATDSRGRSSDTGWLDLSNFDVLAYSVPQITRFNTTRRTDTATTVDIVRAGTHSSLSGGNTLTIRLQRRTSGTSSWTNVEPDKVATGSPFNATVQSTGNSVAASYEFRVYIVDQFGNSAEQISTVSTQRVVLDVHKNEGVGIGKIHEKGVLDVDGEVYLNGKVMALGGLGFEDTRNVNDRPQDIPGKAFSFAFKNRNVTSTPPKSANSTYAHILNIAGWSSGEGSGGFPMQMSIGGDGISLRQGTSATAWGPWSSLQSTSSGSNSNGWWVQYGDGTQIVWKFGVLATSTEDRFLSYEWTYPKAFVGGSILLPTKNDYWGGWNWIMGSVSGLGQNLSGKARMWRPENKTWSSGSHTTAGHSLHLVAIGRWK